MTARTAGPGWIAIGVFVAGHNVLHAGRGDEMLSETMGRWVQKRPVLVRSIIAVFALHLARLLPKRADPLSWLFALVPLIVARRR